MPYLIVIGRPGPAIPGAPSSLRKLEDAEIVGVLNNDTQLAAAKTKVDEYLTKSGQAAQGVQAAFFALA